ncbi:MAG TPA: YidC/Oxa1 family membrane protein insertase [Baekduia sp.]|uniref:YidC/Oxa1 family membrane protein insertase n=1 Tax=Baekduia sp. TaxID=2600305 RepID=UPI002B815C67|nr:YidC/Oxa1 family membrane protein insertase [Baekduia sp.]HMJ35660.1 YidC/Oxa1 family membrane protein insertase [Baekduia sp.]
MPFVFANVLQPLIDVFEQVLLFFHDHVGFGWGMSIIAMTVTVRALMIPLTLKQFKSMQAMQRLAPEIKELQQKYKDDKQRQQQEMMAFYKENQVNPFGSCLPLILQMPVFLSLFYMLRKDLRHDICPDINPANVANPKPCGQTPESQFWFIHDITDKATGTVLVVLLVLYVGTQLVSSLLMMTATADQNQKIIMLVLPFLFVGFVFGFPAGLIMYWITTNIWTIGQQQFLRRVIGHGTHATTLPELPGQADGDKGKPAAAGAGGGAGGLLARLSGQASSAESSSKQAAVKEETRVSKAPPPPPRSRKKKRSGRRR